MKENSEIQHIMENETNNLQATCPVLFPESERRSLLEIERSLIKRYRTVSYTHLTLPTKA